MKLFFRKKLTQEKVLEQFTFTEKLSGKFQIGRKRELQQSAALRFSSSILTLTGKSGFQFSKFYNINRDLDANIPGSEYATMISINQNKF